MPPKPVSVSKDYDDPTTILGRRFANVNHSPALTIVSADLDRFAQLRPGSPVAGWIGRRLRSGLLRA